jgi:hypothetical protein
MQYAVLRSPPSSCRHHRVREYIDAAQHTVASVDGEFQFFGRHFDFPSSLAPRAAHGPVLKG